MEKEIKSCKKKSKNEQKIISKEELLSKVKVVEINKDDDLVFFGTCHCSGTKGHIH